MTPSINEPILLPSTNFVDERGSLIKPSLVHPLSNTHFVFCDVYVSSSTKNVFRGLHYQEQPYQQEKLFNPLSGLYKIYCVSISNHSNVFEFLLSPDDSRTLYVPKGWATGVLAKHDHNSILYCSPQPYFASAEKGISYTTVSELNVLNPILSLKDRYW